MKASKWNSKGGGLRKHRVSGVSHNHALTIARVREENRLLEEKKRLKEKRKGKMFGSVKELFQEN